MVVAAAVHGGTPAEFPTWDKVREAFDAELTSEPDTDQDADTPRSVMMRALGLR